jgi:hypothetical protein
MASIGDFDSLPVWACGVLAADLVSISHSEPPFMIEETSIPNSDSFVKRIEKEKGSRLYLLPLIVNDRCHSMVTPR